MNNAICPFRMVDIDDLNRRLDLTWWPQLPGGERSRGVPVAYLRELAVHWRNGYDRRAAEAELDSNVEPSDRQEFGA